MIKLSAPQARPHKTPVRELQTHPCLSFHRHHASLAPSQQSGQSLANVDILPQADIIQTVLYLQINVCRMRDRDDATRMAVKNTPESPAQAGISAGLALSLFVISYLYTSFDEKSGYLDLIQRYLLIPVAAKPLKNMAPNHSYLEPSLDLGPTD